MSGPSAPAPKAVVPPTSRRDFIIALLCGVAVLGFVVYGIGFMGSRQQEASRMTLTGKVVDKSFTPAPEEQISFGNKGLKTERIAGEFILRVHVAAENRTFEVPVTESMYRSTSVGDNFTFGRPRSERKR